VADDTFVTLTDGVAGLYGKTMGYSHWLVSAAKTHILPSVVVNPWQLFFSFLRTRAARNGALVSNSIAVFIS
jgi:hypothetical protein